jgi:hypothetical protein
MFEKEVGRQKEMGGMALVAGNKPQVEYHKGFLAGLTFAECEINAQQQNKEVEPSTSNNTESFELLSDIKKVLDGGMDVSIRTGTLSHKRVIEAVAQLQNIS